MKRITKRKPVRARTGAAGGRRRVAALGTGGGDGTRRDHPDNWQLRLYVAGQTPKSMTALSNLKALCKDHLDGRYRIEVVDLLEHPHLSAGDQILAIPTLVRKLPQPIRKIIGDLSDLQRVLVGLDLRTRS